MKKRIFLGGAALLFAAATAFNMNMLQGNSVGDVSLDAIAVMARANGEGSNTQTKRDYAQGQIVDVRDNGDGTETAIRVGGYVEVDNNGDIVEDHTYTYDGHTMPTGGIVFNN
jgi:hypothetical protein